jgi:N-acetylated-alpha-linked acidic dipeptidase
MFRKWLMVLFIIISISANAQKITGFKDTDAAQEIQWEKKLDSLVTPANLDTWMQFLSARPHHVGSAQGKANAEYMANLFRQWGYDTKIEEYYVLFPSPKSRVLEIVGSKTYKAKLDEPALSEDKTSSQKSEQLPTYNAYSADGDVTADLIYVNRGIPADYEELARMGISVKGKIVIAKYGGSWRGIKPKVAAENGAIGCIIYSDPSDDGYTAGDVYPKGSFRPGDGVQRGSVMDMPVYPGDPLTPGYGSVKDAKRLDRKDAITIMKIPVIPISYNDALPLLQSLGGPVVPASWRGGLPITYHAGPGTAKVHLKLEFNWDTKPLYNVIATMKGTEFPDQWVIRGNHHDGWVNGAADPLSGMVAEMEEARVISELAKQGYKPKRTIMFCAWDGEEPSLLGSTEWVEDHQEELKQKAVIYINSDGNSRGFIGAAGSHGYETFFNEIITDVKDPQTGVSIRDRRYAKTLADADRAGKSRVYGNKYLKLSALGAGSDYSPFLQYLGISSMNIGFGGEGSGGEYHSIYDSYDLFKRFKDPGSLYGAALAKTGARIMLRMGMADVLPVNFSNFYTTVADYTNEVKTLAEQLRNDADMEKKLAKDKVYELAEDPKLKLQPRLYKGDVPYLDFSSLDNAMAKLKSRTEEFQQLYPKAQNLDAAKKKALNEILFRAERSLLQEKGLPRRTWYKHQIYAPGFYTGYGVKTLPGIREGLEEYQWKEAQDNIRIVAQTLDQFTQQVEAANALLK